MPQPTEESFLKDVANHSLEILKDDGVYRHLRLSNHGSWDMRFDIVTWPGYLAYSGDMGCFVFSRLDDMFEFFRTDRRDKDHLGINLSYWGEKLEAVERSGDSGVYKEFSEEKLKERIEETLDQWKEDYELDQDEMEELRFNVDVDILDNLDQGPGVAFDHLNRFSYPVGGHIFEFTDSWEWNYREYTYRYIWCCYALAWAIKKYDEVKNG